MTTTPDTSETDTTDYTSEITHPVYDDFYKNPFRRTYEDLLLTILVKFDVYSRYYLSDSHFQKFIEKVIIKNEARAHKRKNMKSIQTTVRSYRNGFQRFNTPSRPTCFDQTPNGEYVRATINCKTKRNIILIQNVESCN